MWSKSFGNIKWEIPVNIKVELSSQPGMVLKKPRENFENSFGFTFVEALHKIAHNEFMCQSLAFLTFTEFIHSGFPFYFLINLILAFHQRPSTLLKSKVILIPNDLNWQPHYLHLPIKKNHLPQSIFPF